MNFDEATLIKIENYIQALDENVGLKIETIQDIAQAISKQRGLIKKLTIPVVGVSIASSDVGKCTKCKFNMDDRCTVGTYYAEQGKSRFCIEGELWESN